MFTSWIGLFWGMWLGGGGWWNSRICGPCQTTDSTKHVGRICPSRVGFVKQKYKNLSYKNLYTFQSKTTFYVDNTIVLSQTYRRINTNQMNHNLVNITGLFPVP